VRLDRTIWPFLTAQNITPIQNESCRGNQTRLLALRLRCLFRSAGESVLGDLLGYAAMATGIVAAVLVSANLSRKITGFAVVVFTVSSVAWVAVGLLEDEPPLIFQNIALTGGRISAACPDAATAVPGADAGCVDPSRVAGCRSKCTPRPQTPWPPPPAGCLSRGHA
jgi:hypothetical protein